MISPHILYVLIVSGITFQDPSLQTRIDKITPPKAWELNKYAPGVNSPTWLGILFREQVAIRKERQMLIEIQNKEIIEFKKINNSENPTLLTADVLTLKNLINDPEFESEKKQFFEARSAVIIKFNPYENYTSRDAPIRDDYEKFDKIYRPIWEKFQSAILRYMDKVTLAGEAAKKSNPALIIELTIRKIHINILQTLWEAADIHAKMLFK